MSYKALVTNRFRREYRRLDKPIQKLVDDAVSEITANPELGEQKLGDLAGTRVYKFRYKGRLYLLAYDIDGHIRFVFLLSIKSHQNFYRDLKG